MFKRHNSSKSVLIHFKRWSRKSYASFCSLHKEIKISNLSANVSERLLEKCLMIRQIAIYYLNQNEQTAIDDDDLEVEQTEILMQSLTGQLYPVANKDLYSQKTNIYHFKSDQFSIDMKTDHSFSF